MWSNQDLRSLRMVTHRRKTPLPLDTGYLAQVIKDNTSALMKYIALVAVFQINNCTSQVSSFIDSGYA